MAASSASVRPVIPETRQDTLDEYCKGASCIRYEDELAAMHARARTDRRDGGTCGVAEWGTCGDYHYLDEVRGGEFAGRMKYFDGAGKVIAISFYNLESGAGSTLGTVPNCARVIVGDDCRPDLRK
ncbi:MAG TPA: hypothetical protein VM925_32615 [Labilithrix sp.]|nr:hypothetical protein [Labilithrix sp.]